MDDSGINCCVYFNSVFHSKRRKNSRPQRTHSKSDEGRGGKILINEGGYEQQCGKLLIFYFFCVNVHGANLSLWALTRSKEKIIYRILKEYEKSFIGENLDLNNVLPQTLKISQTYWDNIIRLMDEMDLLKNILKIPGDDIIEYNIRFAEITEKGFKFLSDNSLLSKSYKAVKEIKR